MEKSSKIVITDWGSSQRTHARGNPRGIETEELIKLHKSMYHGMMCFDVKEAFGVVVEVTSDEVYDELEFRKAVPKGYDYRKPAVGPRHG